MLRLKTIGESEETGRGQTGNSPQCGEFCSVLAVGFLPDCGGGAGAGTVAQGTVKIVLLPARRCLSQHRDRYGQLPVYFNVTTTKYEFNVNQFPGISCRGQKSCRHGMNLGRGRISFLTYWLPHLHNRFVCRQIFDRAVERIAAERERRRCFAQHRRLPTTSKSLTVGLI